MARFKELCLDTDGDGPALARFWAAAAGLHTTDDGHGGLDVEGGADHQYVSVCPVPEARTVKNRVHLDVYARSVEDLVALGASLVEPVEAVEPGEPGGRWTVMRDPQGNELCCFVREELPAWRVHGMGVDCVDAEATAAWWGQAYGVPVRRWPGEDFVTLEHTTPDPVFTMDFAPVPEPKTVKNRLHWDLWGTPEEFLDRGARLLWETPTWTTLADPEGNEFCVFPEPAA